MDSSKRLNRADRGTRAIHALTQLHIFGNVDQYGAGTTTLCQPERLVDSIGQVFDAFDQKIVLGDGLRDAEHVGLLEGIAPDKGTGHLPGDGEPLKATSQRSVVLYVAKYANK